MFKWPGTPSPSSREHELADYAELDCWKHSTNSMARFSKELVRIAENDHLDGVPEVEEAEVVVEAAYDEIDRRREACRSNYPFEAIRQGKVIRLDHDSENPKHVIYKFLLLATRLNMKTNRKHAEIDGTHLFEELAETVARNYLGERAQGFVFGTSTATGDFKEKINTLCKKIGEGDRFHNRNNALPREQDGKLDIVVWKSFTDGLAGKLIAFGQCKTGTSYKDTLTQLQPDVFCRKWLNSSPVVTPVRMFFVAEALSSDHWHNTASDAGILFDRCRIIDFADKTNPELLAKISVWTKAAAVATELPT